MCTGMWPKYFALAKRVQDLERLLYEKANMIRQTLTRRHPGRNRSRRVLSSSLLARGAFEWQGPFFLDVQLPIREMQALHGHGLLPQEGLNYHLHRDHTESTFLPPSAEDGGGCHAIVTWTSEAHVLSVCPYPRSLHDLQ